MEKENNKKKVSILIGAIALVLVIIVGITYAYLSANNKTPANSVKAGTLLISYEDDNLDSVRLDNIQPIYDKDIKEKASKILFQVNNTGTAKAYVDINITDISLPSELADLEFKWALYSGEEKISNGNFRNVLDNKLLLTNNQEITSSKNYELYIWISENELDQSDMMEKTFSAKITVVGHQNKQAELLSKVIKTNNPVITQKPDFSKTAETDEGLIQDIDDDGETYYFRGNVKDNYLRIDGLKWPSDAPKAYLIPSKNTSPRIESSMQNAEDTCNRFSNSYGYSSAEECKSDIKEVGAKPGEDMTFRIVRINGDGTIRIVADGSIGNKSFNQEYDSEEYVGYTYKTRTGYTIGDVSEESFSESISATSKYYYADSFTFDTTNGGYTLVNPVQHTGTECNNNKALCEGKYTQFRTSTSKNDVLYQVTTVESATKINYHAYQIKGKAILDSNSENINSTMKEYLDSWYETNMSDYDKLLANTRYCNDTTTKNINSIGYLYYGTYGRLNTSNGHVPEPSYICPNTDKLYGGEYDLKIGLLSADEAVFAGGKNGSSNSNYYLAGSRAYRWLGSPSYFYGSNADEFYLYGTGGIYDYGVQTADAAVPVFNLRSDTLFTQGNGEVNNPYVISVS